MNTVDILDDSTDNDIFIVQQIKPINALTIQDALIIKHNILENLNRKVKSSDKDGKKKKKKEKSSLKTERMENVNNTEKKDKASKKSSNTILNYVKKTEMDSESVLVNETKGVDDGSEISVVASNVRGSSEKKNKKRSSDVSESIQLSPGIKKRRNKFHLADSQSPKRTSPRKYSPKKYFQIDTRRKKLSFKEDDSETGNSQISVDKSDMDFLESDAFEDHLQNLEKTIKQECDTSNTSTKEQDFEDNAELLSFLLTKIISDVMERQMYLERTFSTEERTVEKLFSNVECDILKRFCNLEKIYSKVYVRMLCSTKCWFRLSATTFKDVPLNLSDVFKKLNKENLLDLNIRDGDVRVQLELLSKAEIQELCRLFNVPVKLLSSGKKDVLIEKLIECAQCQKSVVNMFQKNKSSGSSSSSSLHVLSEKAVKYLGTCAKLDETARNTFKKVLLLFSFPHYFEDEEKRFRTQLYMCMNLHKKFICYPSYKLSPTVVFEKLQDFEQYSDALVLQDSFEIAIVNKNYEDFNSLGYKVKEEFEKILKDEKYHIRYSRLEGYLKKFTAGHIYAKLLTKFCSKFKTKSSSQEIITIALLLLGQNLFLISKRGKWYEILSQAYESVKDRKSAAEVLIRAHSDQCVDEVQKLNLQMRAQNLLKRKTNKIEDADLREKLSEWCSAIAVEDPASIEIQGKALEENVSGYKSVYIEETENGIMYTSVEEKALSHYKRKGYLKGCHVEGYVIQTLFGLLFFDIIYEISPPGVFQSAYQECPLDLYSHSFYANRKDSIDLRLKEMYLWTEEEAAKKIKTVYYENYNSLCLIIWKEAFTCDVLCEIMSCITLPALAKICSRIVKNYRVSQVGFPDLTLWNPETKKCKFVEVKSPLDKLSPAQRVWLDFLKQSGIDCEVCNVKNPTRKLLLSKKRSS